MYFRPLGNVKGNEKYENRSRKAYWDEKSFRTGRKTIDSRSLLIIKS
jgi:hypothetical protein